MKIVCQPSSAASAGLTPTRQSTEPSAVCWGEMMNPAKFVPWIQNVAKRYGTDILRMKGIIAMEDDDQRFVVQGVHMLIEGGSRRPWKRNEARQTRVVFIGRDLPTD